MRAATKIQIAQAAHESGSTLSATTNQIEIRGSHDTLMTILNQLAYDRPDVLARHTFVDQNRGRIRRIYVSFKVYGRKARHNWITENIDLFTNAELSLNDFAMALTD